tara:strand:+ start:749 stop:1384 length:636 start_codon:yes stop_codon:yes gene_type:complete
VNEVLELLKQSKSNEEITNSLEQRGFNLQQVSDAISQAKIKMGVEGNMPPSGMEESSSVGDDIPIPDQAPAQQSEPQFEQPQFQQMPQQQGVGYTDMQALVEEVVEEKWREFIKDVGDIAVWKARVADDMEATKQELVRTQRRLEDLQTAVLGKVKDYNQNVLDINREMKALEQVFGKILEPLTANIKDLQKVTEDIKGAAPSRPGLNDRF